MQELSCKCCKHQISVHFDKCPHCGTLVPLRAVDSIRYVAISAAAFAVIIVILSIIRH